LIEFSGLFFQRSFWCDFARFAKIVLAPRKSDLVPGKFGEDFLL